jgi:hypothetical protein
MVLNCMDKHTEAVEQFKKALARGATLLGFDMQSSKVGRRGTPGACSAGSLTIDS